MLVGLVAVAGAHAHAPHFIVTAQHILPGHFFQIKLHVLSGVAVGVIQIHGIDLRVITREILRGIRGHLRQTEASDPVQEISFQAL